MGRKPYLYPHLNFWKNREEVTRLLEIHTKTSGTGRGHKHNVEVLNKSAIVLLVACWEAFVEDLAEDAFSILLRRAAKHDVFPQKVLSEAADPLKESRDSRQVWQLAGDGWREVLRKHKESLFARYIGKLNTPKPEQVDALYESLLGIKAISGTWHWSHMSSQASITKLNELVELRGSIAHRVSASRTVLRSDVLNYSDFVNRVAMQTSNAARSFLLKTTKKEPWPEFSYE